MADTPLPVYTADECYKKRIEDRNEMTTKFCPLIKSTCRADCTAFIEGRRILTSKIGEYHYYGPYCNSPLVSGIISIEDAVTISY